MSSEKISFINRLSISVKFLISIIIGTLSYFLFTLKPALHLVCSWDIFCLVLLSLVWITFYTTSIQFIRIESQKESTGRIIVFFVTILATILSMYAVAQIIISASQNITDKASNMIFGTICMILSWCLVQTIFTSHYAHIYYTKDEDSKASEIGGLDFPGKEKPDFLDFAYFAFTIGMTFQVSDVQITNRRIRRITLFHGMFSFAFNALVIALSVNVISGLVSK